MAKAPTSAAALNAPRPAARPMSITCRFTIDQRLDRTFQLGLSRVTNDRRALPEPSCYPAGPSCAPLAACADKPDTPACQELLRNLRNPFFIGDQPWGTQSTGWADAWISAPSVYAVAAKTAADVSA